MRQRAFTLIELLIVVAIIAILAAIAVPNFLEAQVRSKVSRVKADMRSVATALEAYFVDYNSYTRSNSPADTPLSGARQYTGFRQLTTPVAYITVIPWDAFGQTRGWDMSAMPGCLGMGTGDAATRNPSVPPSGWPIVGAPGYPSNSWSLGSNGPDKMDDSIYAVGTTNYPWPHIDPNNLVQVIDQAAAGRRLPIAALLYDPTNGTVTGGEIIRFGGSKPSGAVYDYFWANSLK